MSNSKYLCIWCIWIWRRSEYSWQQVGVCVWDRLNINNSAHIHCDKGTRQPEYLCDLFFWFLDTNRGLWHRSIGCRVSGSVVQLNPSQEQTESSVHIKVSGLLSFLWLFLKKELKELDSCWQVVLTFANDFLWSSFICR